MRSVFGGYSATPCGVAVFPREILRAPRSWIKAHYNLQQAGRGWGVRGRDVRG